MTCRSRMVLFTFTPPPLSALENNSLVWKCVCNGMTTIRTYTHNHVWVPSIILPVALRMFERQTKKTVSQIQLRLSSTCAKKALQSCLHKCSTNIRLNYRQRSTKVQCTLSSHICVPLPRLTVFWFNRATSTTFQLWLET